MTCFTQGMHDERRSRKAGSSVIAALDHPLDEPFTGEHLVLVECGSGALSILITAENRCGVSQDVRVSVDTCRRYYAVVGPAEAGSTCRPAWHLACPEWAA